MYTNKWINIITQSEFKLKTRQEEEEEKNILSTQVFKNNKIQRCIQW